MHGIRNFSFCLLLSQLTSIHNKQTNKRMWMCFFGGFFSEYRGICAASFLPAVDTNPPPSAVAAYNELLLTACDPARGDDRASLSFAARLSQDLSRRKVLLRSDSMAAFLRLCGRAGSPRLLYRAWATDKRYVVRYNVD
jgi:hypothetical protein